MKKLTVLCFAIAFAATLRADDQLRQVQQALKDQGFYYGEVDGEPGTETSAAIRRYQIRNGFEVTGKLNDETLHALHVATPEPPTIVSQTPAPAEPESTPTPRPNIVESDKNFLRQQPPTAPAEPAERVTPAPVPSEGVTYSQVFQRTPYERAPAVVQRETLRRAQVRLFHDGFYRGEVDGNPGVETEHAIRGYQRDADLPLTGRLDMATLSDMNLLPGHRTYVPGPPPPPDAFDEPPVVGHRVYRGIWVH